DGGSFTGGIDGGGETDGYDRLIIDSSEEYIVDLGDPDDDSRLYVSNLEVIEGNDVSTLQAGDTDNQWWIGDFDPFADEEPNLAAGIDVGQLTYSSSTISFIKFSDIRGGSGQDSFVVAERSTPGSIEGGGGGLDSLTVESVTDQSLEWTVSGSGFSSAAGRVTNFLDIEFLLGSNGDDVFVIAGETADITINGGTGDNSLKGANQENAWDIGESTAGSEAINTLNNSITFSGINSLIGGTLEDVFTFYSDGGVSHVSGFSAGQDASIKDTLEFHSTADEETSWTVNGID